MGSGTSRTAHQTIMNSITIGIFRTTIMKTKVQPIGPRTLPRFGGRVDAVRAQSGEGAAGHFSWHPLKGVDPCGAVWKW